MGLQEEFESLTVEQICNYPGQSKEEHLQLDFKTINNANLKSEDDKRTLAIALSGFANSSGGLIVWGVDARKNKLGIDAATALREIDELGLFCSRLNELTNQAAQPSIEGVIHRKFETSIDKGFAVSLIPESTATPHMAKLGENRYYKRNGQSFLMLEHYDLDDMFGRRPRPNLQLTIKSSWESNEHVNIEISVLNIGRGLAKYVGFFAEVVGATLSHVSRPLSNASSLNPGRQMFEYANINQVIHANSIRIVLGSATLQPTSNDPVRVVIDLYCEYMSTRRTEFLVAPRATEFADAGSS